MSGAHHGQGEIMNREDALNTIDAQDIIADFQGGGGSSMRRLEISSISDGAACWDD